MRCPSCGANNDRVIDSRISDDATTVRRRRECILCGHRFTSYERLERPLPSVRKRDGTVEPFDRAKIERGLRSACRKRPISDVQLEALVDDMLVELERMGLEEVPSEWIGQATMARLGALDPVAYVRFASVYSAFDDVNQFIEVVRNMKPKRVNRRRAKK